MGFDADKFEEAKFTESTAEIAVPSLSPFFDEGEKPVFVIRGLTGVELGKVNEAHEKSKNIGSLVSALAGKNEAEKVEALKTSLGLSDDVPPDVVRRQELLFFGCISPELTHSQAVKLSEKFPVDFYNLTNEILKLTGQGATVGKLKGSGKTKQ